MKAWLRAPLFWILAVSLALRLAGLFWGLPASDGWDNDGFAPRNFLTALALTWKPGSFFTYPPLHAILLAVPALPVAIVALLQAPSLGQHDVIATITQPHIMTYFAVVARLVNIVMSLGIIWCVGEMARLVAGPRAGLLAAAAAALNMVLVYYGQVSNLDVPCLFWAVLSLLACMRAIAFHEPRRFWAAALLAAAAIATKDQGYALFALSLPAGLALWFALDAWPRHNGRKVAVMLLPAAAIAVFALLLVDGAVTNPSGFAHRIAFLTGPASGDYAQYRQGITGWTALLGDMAAYYTRGYGVVALLVALGLGIHLFRFRADRPRWVAGLLPLLVIMSFTLCFNFAALRSDARFLLPQAVLATVYIGIAAERFAFAAQAWLRIPARLALALTALLALHACVTVSAAMWLDPRYDAERWMAAHVAPGDNIEIYGQNCYQPRFPAGARVSRVGQGALSRRNPLPGVIELKQAFSAARNPRFIVLSGDWVRQYLRTARPLKPGRIYPAIQQTAFGDADARRYFSALDTGRLPYRLVHVARYRGKFWPQVHIHDSLDEPIGIFERLP